MKSSLLPSSLVWTVWTFEHQSITVSKTWEKNITFDRELTCLQLGVEYVDLYLIHSPRLAPNIASAWKEMESIRAEGLVKSMASLPDFKVWPPYSLLGASELAILESQNLRNCFATQRCHRQQIRSVDWVRSDGFSYLSIQTDSAASSCLWETKANSWLCSEA